jgi:hypothetical protein
MRGTFTGELFVGRFKVITGVVRVVSCGKV